MFEMIVLSPIQGGPHSFLERLRKQKWKGYIWLVWNVAICTDVWKNLYIFVVSEKHATVIKKDGTDKNKVFKV